MRKLTLFLIAAAISFAQITFPTTTLTNATTAMSPQPVQVGSVANIFPPNIYTGNTIILVDQEAMCVNSVLGLTVSVERGCQGTWTQNHAAGATVYAGYVYYFKQIPPGQYGQTCVAAQIPVLPWIVLPGAEIWNCTNGQWVLTNYGNHASLGRHVSIWKRILGWFK
jgi:hypothetical protein